MKKHISCLLLSASALLLSSCDSFMYSDVGWSGTSTGLYNNNGWSNARYDYDGFPIYGYYDGRPVYGYTSVGVPIYTYNSLDRHCYVPSWKPAPITAATTAIPHTYTIASRRRRGRATMCRRTGHSPTTVRHTRPHAPATGPPTRRRAILLHRLHGIRAAADQATAHGIRAAIRPPTPPAAPPTGTTGTTTPAAPHPRLHATRQPPATAEDSRPSYSFIRTVIPCLNNASTSSSPRWASPNPASRPSGSSLPGSHRQRPSGHQARHEGG